MADRFTAAFDMLYNAMPSARVLLRYGSATVERCLASGITRELQHEDEGLYAGADANLRFLLTDQPAAWPAGDAVVGNVVEVSTDGDTWHTLRANGRTVSAGVVVLAVAHEHGGA